MSTTIEAPASGRRVTPTGVLVLPSTADRGQWLTERRNGITATDLPQIVGASAYGSAADVYADKIGQPLTDDELSEAGEWGVLLEDTVARKWADDRGVTIRRVGLIAHIADHWKRASLDRLVTGCPDGRCGVEIKTRNAWVADQWKDGVPDAVNVQVQWQLHVSGLDHIHVAALIGGQRMVEHVIHPDRVVIEYLAGQAQALWLAVINRIPPVVDPALLSVSLLDRIYQAREGTVILDAADATRWLDDYTAALADENAAKKRKEAAKVQLLAMLGDGEEAAIDDGDTTRVVFTYTAGSDSTTIPADNVRRLIAEHPDIAEQYVVTRPGTRTFRPVKAKAVKS